MKHEHDTVTAELPHLGEPADLTDPAQLGDIARGMLGLPPHAPGAQHRRPVPAWRAALDAAIAADPAGKQGVALALGVSRPYVSRICSGSIPVASPHFIVRVQAVYMQVDCPHLQRQLPPAECQAFARRTYAEVSAFEVDHWRACRRCPVNPVARHAQAGLPKPAAAPATQETAS